MGLVQPGDLSASERLLWDAFPRGTWVDLRTGDPGEDDPAKAGGWGPERVIRAEVIRGLLLGTRLPEPGHRPAVRLRGALITGRLDLIGATVDHALVCEYCCFDKPLRCVEAITRTVRIISSRFPSFNGTRMRTEGIVNFADCVVDEGVRLDRAKVVGEVSFQGARLGANPDGIALAADGITVDGPLDCNAGFTAGGSVLLHGARIEGSLDLTDATIVGTGGNALTATRAVINGPVRAERLSAEGQVGFRNAGIAGDLHLSGARLSDPGGFALSCGGLVIHGGVWCGKGFTAEGELRFIGAELRATFTLHGATLSNPGRTALRLDRAVLGEFTGTALTVQGGQLSFGGTRIVDRLSLDDARLGGDEDENAMVIGGASIGGTLRLRRLHTTGELIIVGSTIGSVLLIDAWLETTDETALRFTRNEVGTNVLCNDLVAVGAVWFFDSRIARNLSLERVCLINPGAVALDARMLQAAELSFLPAQPVEGSVILDHARIGLLRDDPSAWPDDLRLDGLMYETLQPPLPARRRLEWLARDPTGYHPQPYEQLAALYSRAGQQVEARRILHARERHQRATKPFLGRLWSVLQDATVAYGYQPWRPVVWLALLVVIGSVTYGISPPPPLNAAEAPHFNPVIYTLDLLLPIVDLGQERAYNPAGALQWFSYFLVAAGWILATTIAAGVARVVSRR
jgi:hypothetical protein